MHSKVDPAALLIAVFAVGAGPVLAAGFWEPINTVIALIVAVVIWCFMWPRRQKKSDERIEARHLFAQSLVYGFITLVATAWPIQAILLRRWECNPFFQSLCFGEGDGQIQNEVLAQSTYATFWALIPAAAMLLITLLLMQRSVRRSR